MSMGVLSSALQGCGSEQAQAPPTSSGTAELDDASRPPWGLPSDVSDRVAAAGLELGPMGTADHYHPHLRVVIDGQDIPVAGNIGVDPGSGAMSAVHTHEADGTIHIEADSVGETFTLGQLFTQWGVHLSATQLGGQQADSGGRVELTTNGTLIDGDPRDLRLEPDQKIVLRLR